MVVVIYPNANVRPQCLRTFLSVRSVVLGNDQLNRVTFRISVSGG